MNSGSIYLGNRFKMGFIVLFMAFLCSTSAVADSPKIEWDSLVPEVQNVLKPMESSWDKMPHGRQVRMVKGATRYISLNGKQKAKMRKRFLRWKEMPLKRRINVRKMFETFRGLPKDQQAAIRIQFKKFKSLTAKKRKILRDTWKSFSPKKKRRILKQIKNRRHPPRVHQRRHR